MPNKVHLTIPGEPVSKQRPRFSRGRTYTPKETTEAELRVQQVFRDSGAVKLEGNIIAFVTFYVGGSLLKDLDNMEKLVFDALNKLAYEDDRQIREKHSYKTKTAKDKARTVITLIETEKTYEEKNYRRTLG